MSAVRAPYSKAGRPTKAGERESGAASYLSV
jgi:hypothetical protein